MTSKPSVKRKSALKPSSGPSPKGKPELTPTKEASLYAVLRSMSFGEWVTVIGTAFVVLSTVSGGAVWVGQTIEKEKRGALIEAEITPLKKQLSTALDDVATARRDIKRLESASNAMENQVNILIGKIKSEESFALFAEEYINYLAAPSDLTRNILADYVCKLYRESQEARTNLGFTPVSIEEIVQGDFAASIDDLAASGYNVGLLKELRQLQAEGRISQLMPEVSRLFGRSVSPQVVRKSPFFPMPPSDDARRVVSQAEKQIEATSGKLIKIVTFPDHPPFRMPAAVAAQVHSDPRCRIN